MARNQTMVAPIGDKSVKVQIEDLKTGDEGRILTSFPFVQNTYLNIAHGLFQYLGVWITKKQFQKLKSQMVRKGLGTIHFNARVVSNIYTLF